MKKALFIALVCVLGSCNREQQNVTPQAPANTSPLEADYNSSMVSSDFIVTGNCFTGNISWMDNDITTLFEQNGQYWIDSLNYVIKCPLPITLTSNAAFTFNDYYLPSPYSYRITGGNGYLLNDTLSITVNGYNTSTSSCQDPFVFHGKYIQQ